MALVGAGVTASRTLDSAPLFTAQAIRYASAALLLLALARLGRVTLTLPRGGEWLWLAGVAATGLVLFNVAVVRGVAHAEPAVIAVSVACVPVLLCVLGPLLQRRRPTRRVLLAAVLVTAGGMLVEGLGRTDGTGVAWAALALACEAAFTLLAVPVLARHGAFGVSIHAVWLGTLLFTLLALCTEGTSAAARLGVRDAVAIAYLAVLVTAAAFVLWYRTVAAVGADRAGLLAGTAPLAAAGTDALVGGGAPGPLVWLGMLVIVGALTVGLWNPRRPIAPSAPVRPSGSEAQRGEGVGAGPARS
ncbi:DMT family transporter [Streptomyces sp. NPDC006879]|uniref:DMT family transporter n=1 Tax=Streptomyces sp. NPDC006879 TaxID=3364767 RepID=UPI003687B653